MEESRPASSSSPKESEIVCPQPQLKFLQAQLGGAEIHVVEEIQSAQQRVLVLRCCGDCTPIVNDDKKWSEALRLGRNHVVLRIWKGANRWWNLNHTKILSIDNNIDTDDDEAVSHQQELLRTIAEHEVWGYRTARETFQNRNGSSSSTSVVNGASSQHNNSSIFSSIRLPAVLYFSNDDDNNNCNDSNQDNQHEHESPWAIFEYVGLHSALFLRDDEDRKNSSSSSSSRKLPLQWDDSWMTSMIKTRHEFGFLEPHPRWGRVPVPKALEYALTVLHGVVLPLHASSRNHKCHQHYLGTTNDLLPSESTIRKIPAHCYTDVVVLCRQKYEKFLKRPTDNTKLIENRESSLQEAILKLGVAIDKLEEEALAVKSLPPVLCHMDLQPQNILFARHKKRDGGTDDSSSTTSNNKQFIVSVLDWEEAAYADPRFELLMLCRRVCANRAQADCLWQTYQEQSKLSLGSMDPWLRLETVHSVTTLLLQATAGGGRSPWETKLDLRDKITREFERLRLAGWDLGVSQIG